MRFLRCVGMALALLFILSGTTLAQKWQRVATTGPSAAGVPLLLTDGTVIVHNLDSSQWWKLTPDASGDYLNGTWSQIASMPANYGPRYFTAAVLPDGRVFVMGGEYNFQAVVQTNLGAIYDPQTNAWTPLNAPTGWTQIGATHCIVRADGRLMIANPFDTQTALLDPVTLTWTETGTGKADRNAGEGWTLLPDDSILTVDVTNTPRAERYLPSLDAWLSAGQTPQNLADLQFMEIGPAVLRPDGTVFATGATGHTALYRPGIHPTDPGTWGVGPDFPFLRSVQFDIAGGPACLLPGGNVLCGASPVFMGSPTLYFEFDGTNLISVPAPPNAQNDSSIFGNMLLLPTGQVLFTDFSKDVEIYTPVGAPQNSWRPTITQAPTIVTPNQTFGIQGTQFNGLSQGSNDGNGADTATNYPLVRITNQATGHVFYCRTFGHSTMGVATGATPTFTHFTLPTNIEGGEAIIEVVANGIASTPVGVFVDTTDLRTIQSVTPPAVPVFSSDFTLTVNGSQFQNGDQVQWSFQGNTTPLLTIFVSPTQLLATVPAALSTNIGVAFVSVLTLQGGLSNSVSVPVTNLPVLSAINPTSVTPGAPAFPMTLTGINFDSTAIATWTVGSTQTFLTTTFVSPTTVTALVPASLIATTGNANLSVSTRLGVSGTLAFSIVQNPLPTVTSIAPATVAAGGPAFTLTVNGTNFVSTSSIQWNGKSIPTTYLSATQLQAVIPASSIAKKGAFQISVSTPKPGGGLSNKINLTAN